jgi:protein-disulfide isomerase
MNKKIALVVVLVVLAAVGYQVMARGGGGATLKPVEIEGLDDLGRLVELAQGVEIGDPSAAITIAEFGDFQCPGCAQFAMNVKPQVDLAYVQTAQAKFVYYDFPIVSIHPHAFLAARAGRCANDQGEFWSYHDLVFRRQSAWAGSPNPPVGTFEDYAAEVGLDQETFRACLRSDAHADVVTANMRLGQELGVSATPTVMISKGQGTAVRPEVPSFEGIRVLMDQFLAADSAGGGQE